MPTRRPPTRTQKDAALARYAAQKAAAERAARDAAGGERRLREARARVQDLARDARGLSGPDLRAVRQGRSARRLMEATRDTMRLAARVDALRATRPRWVRVIAAAEAARDQAAGRALSLQSGSELRRAQGVLRTRAAEQARLEESARKAVRAREAEFARVKKQVVGGGHGTQLALVGAVRIDRHERIVDVLAPSLGRDARGVSGWGRRPLSEGYVGEAILAHLEGRREGAARAGAAAPDIDETSVREVSCAWAAPVAMDKDLRGRLEDALVVYGLGALRVDLHTGPAGDGRTLVRVALGPEAGAWSPADLLQALPAIGAALAEVDRILREAAAEAAGDVEYWFGEEIDDWPDYDPEAYG